MSGSAALYEVIVVIVSALAAYPLTTVAQHGGGGGEGGGGATGRNRDGIERESKGKDMIRYMNNSADPCIDFYEYACGNWPEFHKAKREGEVTTPQQLLENRVNKLLQEKLEVDNMNQESIYNQKMKAFYRTCLIADSTSDRKQDFLLNFVKNFGGLPSVAITNYNINYNWVQIVAQLRATYGLDILIGLENDLDEVQKKSVFLAEPRATLIPVEFCSEIATNSMDIKDEPYEILQREISENWQSWLGARENDANRIAGDIVRFEFELCKKMRSEHTLQQPNEEEEESNDNQIPVRSRTGQRRLHGNRQRSKYPQHNLQQFTRMFGGVIDFKKFVDTSLKMTINTEVYMKSEPYFQHLVSTVKTSLRPTLINYIMYRALSIFNFPRDDSAKHRAKNCVDIMLKYFAKPLGLIYQRTLRADLRTEIGRIYQISLNAFKDNVSDGWMETNAKNVIRQKLAQFDIKFPQYENYEMEDLQLNTSFNFWQQLDEIIQSTHRKRLDAIYSGDFSSSAEQVEATDARIQFSAMGGEVRIGLAIMQAPFYEHFYGNALKYAVIGQQMSREIAVAALTEPQLTEYDESGLQNRTQCLRTQYSNYLYNNPSIFRNGSKLNQLMADVSGLNVAFRSYLGWLEDMDPSHRYPLRRETLPEMDFTNTQLFFIAFAQSRCVGKYDNEPPPEFLPLDRHTPERFNINGPLMNSVEFAREFSCSMGSEMNPDDKCVIF